MATLKGLAWRSYRNGWGYGGFSQVPLFSIERDSRAVWCLYCPPPPVSYALVAELGDMPTEDAQNMAMSTAVLMEAI